MTSRPAPAVGTPHSTRGAFGFNLGAIALALSLAGLLLAYAIDAAGRQGQQSGGNEGAGATLTRTLAGRDLQIPASWFRYAEQRLGGFAKQIDLQLLLPLGPDAQMRLIEITLLPRSRVRPSASLLDGVYLHQFLPGERNGPPGLIGKPLAASDSFEHETVWYDALSPDPFVAKCSAPIVPDAPSRCVRTVNLGPGIAAVYAFDQDVLANWRRFDAELRIRLGKIGVY